MEKPKSLDRRPLANAEVYNLWMISGGICTFDGCNQRLIVDNKGKLTNIGIVAHIIGHRKKAARHEFAADYGYSDDNLEDLGNLMLMCNTHAKLIDDHHTRASFPPDLLFKMKQEHEAMVRSWSDEKRKSLAIVHKRFGPPLTMLPLMEYSSNIMVEAIEIQNEFIDFSKEGWEKGKKDNLKLYQKFVARINKEKYDVAEVYAISPIPLLIHLGSLLSDTVPLTVYQYDRESKYWVNKIPTKIELEELAPSTSFVDNESKELVVTISISGIITQEDVHVILGKDKDQFNIVIENPHSTRLLFSEQVQEIQKKFKGEVEALHLQKKYDLIHLLYTGPAGLAIELGRSINKNMWPEVAVYEYKYRENPRYHYALTI